MIIVYHKNNKIAEVEAEQKTVDIAKSTIAETVFEIAAKYPDNLIVWCHIDFKPNLNISAFNTVFHHHKIMASYNPGSKSFLSDAIGYVEESPFIKINKKVSYPTWQMSSCVGGVHASVLLALKEKVETSEDFDYFLNSLAKLTMEKGLLCYSEPTLLTNVSVKPAEHTKSLFTVFKFVKQHYRTRWVFLLFLDLFLYQRKLAILPLFSSLFYKKRKLQSNLLDQIKVQSARNIFSTKTIDVIIPTIGRKKYLYDVLKDLSVQSHLPENVIIVEQNTDLESVSELDYIQDESWPFTIKHTFTHQAGACNARNIALSQVESEWVFLNDDDNRFDTQLIEDTLKKCTKFGATVVNNCYLKLNEKKESEVENQASIFGSGNCFMTSVLLDKVSFRMGFEFGYAEDTDFGMQLRNLGSDILYFPTPEILHLSAPIGGFRTKPVLAWKDDIVQPKPSPTVMLCKQLHLTNEQINGYRTVLFFKFYKVQTIKNPIRYFKNFKKQWKQSLHWSNELINK